MIIPLLSRREFATRLPSLFPVLGFVGTGLRSAATVPIVAQDDGISRTAESIHHVVVLKASRDRVYETLMDAKQFGKASGGQAAEISREAGGAFSLFGGRIKGRHVELVPHERIVQAWRSEIWEQGVYSIARFELVAQDAGTKLVFDHTGFPTGQAEHLASGWKSHYWDPLAAYLAS